MYNLLLATSNIDKRKELESVLNLDTVNILSLSKFNLAPPEENGKSFSENALIKAKYYAKHTKYTTLADDSGLEIPALDNAPGIYSKRWAQKKIYHKQHISDISVVEDYDYAFNTIKDSLIAKNLDPFSNEIKARFICILALYNIDNNQSDIFEGYVEGKLCFPAKGSKGFGYDPIFIANGYNDTFATIGKNIKNKISHRSIAMNQFIHYYNKIYDKTR